MEGLCRKVPGNISKSHRDLMKKNVIKKSILLLIASMLAFLSSCKGIELENKTEQVEEYTRAQAMIIISNERSRYEKAYSDEIWKISAGDDETTFDLLVIKNVKDYLEKIKLLCMMAEENGVSLTSTERESVKQMTDAYMQGLSSADLSYTGAKREDVLKMYTDFYTAVKMAEYVSVSDTDLSDSEVKVIRIMQIVTDDVKKAKAILKRVKIDEASFSSMASRFTESPEIELTLYKSDSPGLIERTAFSLEEGQISNILCVDGLYYIIRCTNGYDMEATLKRKEGLLTALRSLNFYKELEPYGERHNIVFFEHFWNELSFREPAGNTSDNFFDIFEAYRQEDL